MESIIGSDFDKPDLISNLYSNPHRQCLDQITYLQQISQKIKSELDLMPVKEYTYNRVKHGDEGDEKSVQEIKTIKPQKSMLEEDIFQDPEEERERYLRMFLPDYQSESSDIQESQANVIQLQQLKNLNHRHEVFSSDDSLRRASDSDIIGDTDYQKSMKPGHTYNSQMQDSFNQRDSQYYSRSRLQNEGDSDQLEEIDFQLTMTQKGQTLQQQSLKNGGASKKQVTFKNPFDLSNQDPSMITRRDLPNIAQSIISEKLLTIKEDLQQIYDKNTSVQDSISEQYHCDNIKVLEVVLEHILFHWDDIMEVLIDDLLEEEALEMNKIEDMKRGKGLRYQNNENTDQSKKARNSKLADKSIHGKFHDYRSVDVRDILKIFDEYKEAETSIKNRL